jgi:iron complex outermembrane receptor protein
MAKERIGRTFLLASTAWVAIAALSGASAAQSGTAYQFNIPAEPLSSALVDFGLNTSQQIIFSTELVQGQTAPALHGRYTSGAALSILLQHTDLEVSPAGSGVLSVQKKKITTAAADKPPIVVAQATPVPAAPSPGTLAQNAETVIVTGTRVVGMTAADSAAPITVLGTDALTQGVGSPNLLQALGQTLPSLNIQTNGGDLANATLSANLRGLSPNDTLVLVNGKRRHGSSVFNVGNGGAAPDFSLIPDAAIDHIEVLLDGAAAQYGTDAIAGVVNIILKNKSSGGQLSGSGGQFYNREGQTYNLSFDIGLPLFDRGFVDFTIDKKFHERTQRGGADSRLVNALGQETAEGTIGTAPNAAGIITCTGGVCIPLSVRRAIPGASPIFYGYPDVNHEGDAEYNITSAMYNAEYDFSDAFKLYSFGSYSHRDTVSDQNFRLPNQNIASTGSSQPCSAANHQGYNTAVTANGITPACAIGVTTGSGVGVAPLGNNGLNSLGQVISSGQAGTLYTPGELEQYPEGFEPLETLFEDDYQYNVGTKLNVAGWDVDISGSYAKDIGIIHNINTGNRSLFIDTHTTPNSFYAGRFTASELVATIDVSHQYNIGMASPLTVAAGLEAREDTYGIGAGDPLSYYKEGSQGFPGYTPSDAGFHSRKNYAAYIDFAIAPIEALQIDIAGRAEHYTDFGDAQIGKITARYDFSPQFAVRGTLSTGFRAPTLEEEFYTATNVTPTSATVQLQADSPAAKVLGLPNLRPEISTSYSAGVVSHPLEDLSLSIDAYTIALGSRIARSGTVNSIGGAINTPLVNTAILTAGNALDPTATQNGVSSFVNAFSTTTRGVDITVNYPTDFDDYGLIDWTFGANYNETALQYVNSPPALLTASNSAATFFQPYILYNFVHSAPQEKAGLTANWTLDQWGLTLRETYYGPVHNIGTPNGGPPLFQQNEPGVGLLDAEARYNITEQLQFAVGGNNVFNIRPKPGGFTTTTPNASNGSAQLINTGSAVDFYPAGSVFNPNGGYYYARVNFKW